MDISVVIPLFNKEHHIERAIKSVLSQKKQPKEILVIDDGSTDRGVDIATKLSKKYEYIRVFRKENQGPSIARNWGIDKSKGDFIAFLDADDEWKSDYLTEIKKLYDNFPACGAYATGYEIVYSLNNVEVSEVKSLPPFPWIGIIPSYFELIQDAVPFFTSSIVVTKDLFGELGKFPAGIHRGEDQIMWTKIALRFPIAYSPSSRVVYHKDASNRICNTISNLAESEFSKILSDIIKNRLIKDKLTDDLKDYYTYIIINKVLLLIKNGHTDMAKTLLKREIVVANKKYRKKIMLMNILAVAPPKILSWLLSIRSGENF
jgi:glycosyltransferase involved in cell wall biosynthesis